MDRIGIRALKQNASEVVARAAAGETLVVTDRGRPVAQLGPLPASAIDGLVASGRARPARGDLRALPVPEAGPALTPTLAAMRDDERS